MEKSKIAQFVSIVLKLILFGGIISLFFIPILYDTLFSIQNITFDEQNIYYKITFYLSIINGLSIIYQLIRIFDDIYKSNPFKKETVINLKIIAVLFMFLSFIVAIKIIFVPTVLSVAVSFITFIVSLSFYILSQIFKVAIQYKDEIDYTV